MMKLKDVKILSDQIRELRRVPIALFRPFVVMVSPVYVYLPKNGKHVSVKRPLHFFLPEELKKLEGYQNFYLPEFVESVIPFQKAGEAVGKLLGLSQRECLRSNLGVVQLSIPVAPQDRDDAILRLVGPLWGDQEKVEPYFLAHLVNEVCEPFTPEVLAAGVERGVEEFELAFLRSNLVVFLALQIGYSDYRFLSRIRARSFELSLEAKAEADFSSLEIHDLYALALELVPARSTREILFKQFRERKTRVARKLSARLSRVQSQMAQDAVPFASVFGEKGIYIED